MASLTGNQINNSYQGLLKTESNGAIGVGLFNVTDGLGNQAGLQLNPANSEISLVGNGTQPPRLKFKSTAVNPSFVFAHAEGGDGVLDAQINYVSEFGEMTFIGRNATGPFMDFIFKNTADNGQAGIAMDAYDSTNNSNNWFIGYQRSVSSLSFDNVTRNLTLGRTNSPSLIVNIPDTDTDTTYDLTSAQSGLNAQINLTGSDASLDTITLVAGNNITLTDDGSNNITIAATGGAGGGVTSVNTLAGALTLAAGAGIAITDNGSDTITITNAGAGGSPGLINGTGTNSLISAPFLTGGTGGNATQNDTIAIGRGSFSNAGDAIAIGVLAQNSGAQSWASIAIGANTVNLNNGAIAMGGGAQTSGTGSFAIGDSSRALGTGNISLGNVSRALAGTSNINIGNNVTIPSGQGNTVLGAGFITLPTGQNDNVAIGRISGIGSSTSNSISIGLVSSMGSNCGDTVVIGRGANSLAGSTSSVAIGRDASVQAPQTVAIGYQAVAVNSGWTATPKLEITGYATLNFTDDTAAAAGGVPLGGIYHNAGALRIRIA